MNHEPSGPEPMFAVDMVDTPVAQLAAQPFTLWMQSCTGLQAESIRFFTDRAVKGLRVAQRLAGCATPVQAFGIGAEFALQMARDYAREGRRLVALAAGDFRNSAAALI